MRILLAQRLPCFPALTGEAKLNQALLARLAARNHACRIIALASAHEHPEAVHELRRELARRGPPDVLASSDPHAYVRCGVQVHVVPDAYHLWTSLADQIHQFAPDCVLISQDRTFLGLATALAETEPARVIFLAHSQSTLPFGPACFSADEAKATVLKRAGHVVAFSRYMADYLARWGDLDARVFAPPAYGPGPFANLARHDAGFVTLVNPSQLKGISIFEALARARPDVAFAAVPTWATTTVDLERLRSLGNVRVLPASEHIDDILERTRILLVPSLWGEAFGLIVVEAMLRGIPVLASDSGGLPEAKMGVDYVLPVRPIVEYREDADERGLPIPIVPRQDVEPWLQALDRLTGDAAHYAQVSDASRAAASKGVAGIDIAPFEEFLLTVSARRPRIRLSGHAEWMKSPPLKSV